MFGGLVGRATSAFLILRREDPQKVPEPRGRKQQESQAPGGGGGQVENSLSQGCLHPPEPRHGQRQEGRLSPRALQALPGSFARVQLPQWRPEPQPPRTPGFQGGREQAGAWGARVPVRDFSRGKKRPETLL
ncbi:unnamed protein product [Rangifer tarandus platyrhynchus]|uniref:Uncharacterized protein n=2 Tax=Rangifer tarandus platyrhynchus TaxID=3082113 RepID=A0ACB0FD72_RANTA|nr:unnamed protein product [Rangifer tarandus platyrhynchus]CAI9711038.1 unnamed protein product [Rangifer tarandus platyrhynchus]